MKILYLHQYFVTPSMSGGTRSYEIARRLVAMGHQVVMVTSDQGKTAAGRWAVTVEEGIEVHWYGVPYSNKMSFPRRILAFIGFAIASSYRAMRIRADVVFATSTPLTIVIPGFLASRWQAVPMVFEVRDLWPELPIAVGALRNGIAIWFARLMEGFAYASANKVIALSPGMAQGVIRRGKPAADVTVVTNSADLDAFEPNDSGGEWRARLGATGNSVLVVYVGTLGYLNEVSYLVHLAAEMRNDDRFRFAIVGDGADWQIVHRLASELGVLGINCCMHPSVAKNEVPRVFAAADISLSLFRPMPEMEVNSANKFFDGLASGRCIAINYGGWQAALLHDSGAGFQLSRDYPTAASQLRDVTRERLQQHGRNARALAEREFSRDKAAVAVERVLASAVETV